MHLPEMVEGKLRYFGVLAIASGSMAIGSCGGESPAHLPITFDDLGGGSPIIQVYPGVSDSQEDKVSNGTYKDGDTVVATCKKIGRLVTSDPGVGEEDRHSNEWFGLNTDPKQYATAVFIENAGVLLRQLPIC